MSVHVIGNKNSLNYAQQIEENFRIRHMVFAEQQNWEALKRPDRRDIDQFDNEDATHLLALSETGETVLGGSRFTPLDKPSLLTTVFPHLMTRPLPDSNAFGLDWTRFYVNPENTSPRFRRRISGDMFCAVMEYALLQGASFITFVSNICMIDVGTAYGWHIEPLGPPKNIENKATVAAWIRVDEQALRDARNKTGRERSALFEMAKDSVVTQSNSHVN